MSTANGEEKLPLFSIPTMVKMKLEERDTIFKDRR